MLSSDRVTQEMRKGTLSSNLPHEMQHGKREKRHNDMRIPDLIFLTVPLSCRHPTFESAS